MEAPQRAIQLMTLDDARKAIIQYVKQEQKLNFGIETDRHRGFFAWRRATTIGTAHAPLLADPDLKTFKARIKLEYGQLDAFIETKVSSLNPFVTDKTPNHLDLKDLSKPKSSTPSGTAKDNETKTHLGRVKSEFSILRGMWGVFQAFGQKGGPQCRNPVLWTCGCVCLRR